MYYWVDENGKLIESQSSDIIDDDILKDSIPSVAPGAIEDDLYSEFIDSISDSDLQSGSGLLPGSENLLLFELPDYDFLTYDELIDALSLVPGYNIYPNTAAINVFDGVFRGLGNSYMYVIMSGPDTSSTYMYYSKQYTKNNNQITLLSPVTQLSYYSQRIGTTTNYYYTVNNLGDTSFNLSNQLVYTNLDSNYPNLPSDNRMSSFAFSFTDYVYIILLLVLVFSIIYNFFRRK